MTRARAWDERVVHAMERVAAMMRKMFFVLAWIGLAVFLFMGGFVICVPTRATLAISLEVEVQERGGRPVEGAKVRLYGGGPEPEFEEVTGNAGRVEFPNVDFPAFQSYWWSWMGQGRYRVGTALFRVEVEQPGFRTYRAKLSELMASRFDGPESARLKVVLQPGEGED
jgi:hypothetical protein